MTDGEGSGIVVAAAGDDMPRSITGSAHSSRSGKHTADDVETGGESHASGDDTSNIDDMTEQSESDDDQYREDDDDDDDDDYASYITDPNTMQQGRHRPSGAYTEETGLAQACLSQEMGLVDGEYWEWPVWEHRTCWGFITVRKIGKIIVLAEWMGSSGKRKRVVVGPYWYVPNLELGSPDPLTPLSAVFVHLLCPRPRHFLLITLSIIGLITMLIYATVIPDHMVAERIVGLSMSLLSMAALLCTAMTDPGIYPRHAKPLDEKWTYSEYAQSYRPEGVIYCQQCQVLIEEYNHFCPWSGIVIGKGNEACFQTFITSTTCALIYDVVVVAMSLSDQGF
jgi:hypothetical protein